MNKHSHYVRNGNYQSIPDSHSRLQFFVSFRFVHACRKYNSVSRIVLLKTNNKTSENGRGAERK